MSKRSRKLPRPRRPLRPELVDPRRCVICRSPRIAGGGIWFVGGLARSIVGRSIIPYALCASHMRPGIAIEAERAIVRRAEELMRGKPRPPGERPKSLVLVARVGNVPIGPGSDCRLTECHECHSPTWATGGLLDELESLGIEATPLCEVCLRSRPEPAEVPA